MFYYNYLLIKKIYYFSDTYKVILAVPGLEKKTIKIRIQNQENSCITQITGEIPQVEGENLIVNFLLEGKFIVTIVLPAK
jgi:HSP20 family molecular chaperone IbpA